MHCKQLLCDIRFRKQPRIFCRNHSETEPQMESVQIGKSVLSFLSQKEEEEMERLYSA